MGFVAELVSRNSSDEQLSRQAAPWPGDQERDRMRARPLITTSLWSWGFARFVVLGVYMHPYADDSWSYAYTAFDLPLLERLFQEYVGWNGH